MDDKADPASGWPIDDVQAVPLPASGDWYGKLYIYLHNLFQEFLARIQSTTVTFRLFNVDAMLLPNFLDYRYTRIEVTLRCAPVIPRELIVPRCPMYATEPILASRIR